MKQATEKLYTISDYARAYGISRQAVYNKIKRGELTIKVIGGVKFVVAR